MGKSAAHRADRAGIPSVWSRAPAAVILPLLIGLLTWGLYLPSASQVVQLSPDMVEFVDVARRFVNGEGYVQGVKSYHIGGPEVIQDGMIHRPPLFTLVMAGILKLGFGLPAVQVVNAVFGSVSAAMVCSLGLRLFGRTVGIAAGVLAAANPIALEQQVPILSDALATALTLVAVRLLVEAVEQESIVPAALAGLAFGLGYLTRPPVVVILVAVALVLPLVVRDRRLLWRLLSGLLAGAAVIGIPTTLYSLVTRGRLSYSGKGYLYGVVSDADIMENGFSNPILSPVEFISSRPLFVLERIQVVATLYARSILLEREWLLPLCLGWPGTLVALVTRQYRRIVWIPLAAAAANYVFYALTWSSWQDRFMLTTVFLLLPFVVDGLLRGARAILHRVAAGSRSWRLDPARVFVGVVVVMTAWLWSPRFLEQYDGQFRYGERPAGTRVTDGLRWTGPPRWVNNGSFDEVLAWIRSDTSPDAVLAHGQPWPFALFSGRPVVLLPYELSDERFRTFLIEYRVSYILYDPRDPQRRSYRDQLDDLEDEGIQSRRIESMVIYDTRPLWQGR